MTDRKKPPAPLPFPDMSFEEVLARLLQTDPAELADSVKEMREKEKGGFQRCIDCPYPSVMGLPMG
jgi:hypothetical protein